MTQIRSIAIGLVVTIMMVAAFGTVAATSNSDGSATTSTNVSCRVHIYNHGYLCNTTTEINSTSTQTVNSTIIQIVNSTTTTTYTQPGSTTTVYIAQQPPFFNVTVGQTVYPCQTAAQYAAYEAIYGTISAQGTWTGCHGVVGDAVLP